MSREHGSLTTYLPTSQSLMSDMTDVFTLLNREYGKLLGSSPKYRYMTRDGSKDRYFYTTEKINHNGKPRYVAGIYRYLKSRNVFKMVKSSGFAKKYRAIAAATAFRDKERTQKATPTGIAS